MVTSTYILHHIWHDIYSTYDEQKHITALSIEDTLNYGAIILYRDIESLTLFSIFFISVQAFFNFKNYSSLPKWKHEQNPKVVVIQLPNINCCRGFSPSGIITRQILTLCWRDMKHVPRQPDGKYRPCIPAAKSHKCFDAHFWLNSVSQRRGGLGSRNFIQFDDVTKEYLNVVFSKTVVSLWAQASLCTEASLSTSKIWLFWRLVMDYEYGGT